MAVAGRIVGGLSNEPLGELRAHLRASVPSGGASYAHDEAVRRLVDAFSEPLLVFCKRLARGCPQAGLDGEDLAALAWSKTLRYLAGPRGERVTDAEHFLRVLNTTARQALLDALEKQPQERPLELDAPVRGDGNLESLGERLAHPRPTPEACLLPADSDYLALVEELFTDPEGFHKTYRQKDRRTPRQYQALVLYQVGTLWREEVGTDEIRDPERARFIRDWLHLLGVKPEQWESIERAARQPGPEDNREFCPALAEAVNAVCGTHLRSLNLLRVLRHEMNRFAAQRRQRSPSRPQDKAGDEHAGVQR